MVKFSVPELPPNPIMRLEEEDPPIVPVPGVGYDTALFMVNVLEAIKKGPLISLNKLAVALLRSVTPVPVWLVTKSTLPEMVLNLANCAELPLNQISANAAEPPTILSRILAESVGCISTLPPTKSRPTIFCPPGLFIIWNFALLSNESVT